VAVVLGDSFALMFEDQEDERSCCTGPQMHILLWGSGPGGRAQLSRVGSSVSCPPPMPSADGFHPRGSGDGGPGGPGRRPVLYSWDSVSVGSDGAGTVLRPAKGTRSRGTLCPASHMWVGDGQTRGQPARLCMEQDEAVGRRRESPSSSPVGMVLGAGALQGTRCGFGDAGLPCEQDGIASAAARGSGHAAGEGRSHQGGDGGHGRVWGARGGAGGVGWRCEGRRAGSEQKLH